MTGFLGDAYLWVKALHIIAFITWMAGMLYLPRLYVYHCEAEPGSRQSETFKVMERRLLRAIINPAMIGAWILGIMLAAHGDLWGAGWLHAKLALLIAMQLVHAGYARWRRQFAADRNRHSARFYRVMNEVPTVLMIAIVFLAVLRPF
ncbi:MAG: protoporphyrinogen oxidase HemJ [Kiloniellales bacterium]|jgi:putative membrane protein|nr:protoporphyrinogen oxidase HemJ [Kiloniellales bacterium]